MATSATSDPSARADTAAPAVARGSPTFSVLAAVAPPLCAWTPAAGPGDDDDDDDDTGRGGGSGGSIDPDEDDDIEDDEEGDEEDDDDEDPLWASRPLRGPRGPCGASTGR